MQDVHCNRLFKVLFSVFICFYYYYQLKNYISKFYSHLKKDTKEIVRDTFCLFFFTTWLKLFYAILKNVF